jgi:hypothetical protein
VVMKSILIIVFSILTLNVHSQNNPRIPQRTFNYGLSYGPRSNGSFYSVGYEFNRHGSNANIELGYRKIMLGLNMFSPETWVLNSNVNKSFVSVNYVFRHIDYTWFMLVTGVGMSIDPSNQYMFKIGTNIELSYPLFLTLNFYQTDISQLMIGFKIITF